MQAGINWSWETFPEFLDTIDALPKGINYAGYIGHSALAHLRHGRTRVQRRGGRGRAAGDVRPRKEAVRGRCDRFLDLAHAQSRARPTTVPVASRLADWERSARDRQRGGRNRPRLSSRLPVSRSGATRSAFAKYHERLARSGGRVGRAADLGYVRSPPGPGLLASRISICSTRPPSRRADVCPGAFARAEHDACPSRPRCRSTAGICGATCARYRSRNRKRKLRDRATSRQAGGDCQRPTPAMTLVGVEARPPDYDSLLHRRLDAG